MKKESSLSKLLAYAGKFRYLTIASWILSVISACLALIPFYYIWRIMKEVLSVAPDFGKAAHLKEYGWAAVGFAILSMLVYVCALMCSHLAAFRVQANIRTSLMRHILTLPMGFLDKDGTGKSVKSSMNPAQQQRPIWRTSCRIRQEPLQHRQVF